MDFNRRTRAFEFAPVAQIQCILAADQRVSSTARRFIDVNTANCYIAVNVWLNILADFCGGDSIAYSVLDEYLVRDGLRATILALDSAVPNIISGRPADGLPGALMSAIDSQPDTVGTLHLSRMERKLLVCRFLKRFTFLECDILDREAIDEFIHRQAAICGTAPLADGSAYSTVIQGWRNHGRPFIDKLREHIQKCIDWNELCRAVKYEKHHHRFTSGASSDAGTAMSGKLNALFRINPDFAGVDPSLFKLERPVPPETSGYDVPMRFFHREPSSSDEVLGCPDLALPTMCGHRVSVRTAPKSIKGPRIIAMEPVFYQTAGSYVQKVLYSGPFFPAGMDLRDQGKNQRLVMGSDGLSYATIDLSAASDWVSKELILQVFPDNFLREVWYLVPTRFSVPKGSNAWDDHLGSFATMGNGLTFWVMSILLYAAITATSELKLGEPIDPERFAVYGDDLVVPVDLYDDVLDNLALLGFIVNREKSYGSGLYRETCGIEVYSQKKINSCYYPRFGIHGEITDHLSDLTQESRWDAAIGQLRNSAVSAIALHNRLYDISWRASTFLSRVICDSVPQMTTSSKLTSHTLWGKHGIVATLTVPRDLEEVPDLIGLSDHASDIAYLPKGIGRWIPAEDVSEAESKLARVMTEGGPLVVERLDKDVYRKASIKSNSGLCWVIRGGVGRLEELAPQSNPSQGHSCAYATVLEISCVDGHLHAFYPSFSFVRSVTEAEYLGPGAREAKVEIANPPTTTHDPWCFREVDLGAAEYAHLSPVVIHEFGHNYQPDALTLKLYDLWRFGQFLQYGPRPLDTGSAVEGLTQPDPTPEEFLGQTRVVFKLKV